MRIGLLGDTHGNKVWTRFSLWKFHKEGITTILQVGDFGIYQDKRSLEFLKLANTLAAEYGQTIYVVPGNHEDWRYINKTIEESTLDSGWAQLRSNILLAPRGHRWEWDGVTFVGLGGAPSVDRGWRMRADAQHPGAKNPLWDPNEAITLEDVYNTVQGGHAEVMVAHDAPANVTSINRRIASNPHGFERADLLYAADGRELMTQAYRGVYPLTFIHGHYHFVVNEMIPRPNVDTEIFDDRAAWTHVVGLDCDGSAGSLGHYDTETRTAHVWDVTKDIADYNKQA
jgi:hypothetical protein